MLRIAQFGDTHLGYRANSRSVGGINQRTLDTERAFNRVCNEIAQVVEDSGLDLVIHTGDVFDHVRPTYRSLTVAIGGFQRIAATGVSLVIIGGNHDTPSVKKAGSVFDVLSASLPDNVYINGGYGIEWFTPTGQNGETIDVVTIPYGAIRSGLEIPEELRDLPEIHDSKYRVFVAHGTLEGEAEDIERVAGYDIPRSITQEFGTRAFEFDHFALGHLHTKSYRHRGSRVLYNGSTERFGLGDRDATPGWWMIPLDKEHWGPVRVQIATRWMVNLGDYCWDKTLQIKSDDQIEQLADSIAWDIVRAVDRHSSGMDDHDRRPMIWVSIQAPSSIYSRIVKAVKARHDFWNVTFRRVDVIKPDSEEEERVVRDSISISELLRMYTEEVMVDKYGEEPAREMMVKMQGYLEQAEEAQVQSDWSR